MLHQLLVIETVVVSGQYQAVIAGDGIGVEGYGMQVKVVVALARERRYVRIAVVDMRPFGLQQIHDFYGG